MFYGAPVTGPMEVTDELVRSPWSPEDPELKELPGILDAGLSGLRLQNTEVKAMPGMPDVDTGTKTRAIEAAEYARDLGLAADRFRQAEVRSRTIARYKNYAQERASKNFSKDAIKAGTRRSRYNQARERANVHRSLS